MAQLIRT